MNFMPTLFIFWFQRFVPGYNKTLNCLYSDSSRVHLPSENVLWYCRSPGCTKWMSHRCRPCWNIVHVLYRDYTEIQKSIRSCKLRGCKYTENRFFSNISIPQSTYKPLSCPGMHACHKLTHSHVQVTLNTKSSSYFITTVLRQSVY